MSGPREPERPDPSLWVGATGPAAPRPGGDLTSDEVDLHPSTRFDRTGGSLTVRVLRTLWPVVVVAAVTLLLAGGAAFASAHRLSAADDAAATARDLRRDGAAVEQLWTTTLAVVAGGVGDRIADAGDVEQLAGALGGNGEGAEDPDGGASSEPTPVDDFVLAVRRAVTAADGSPVELGSDVAGLRDRYEEAAASVDRQVRGKEAEAADARRAARSYAALAGVALLAGAIATVLALAVTRRQLRLGLDRPLVGLLSSARHLGSEPTVPTVQGFPELVDLGSELDGRSRELSREISSLRSRAEWGEATRRIVEALELTDDEDAVHEVVARALRDIDPGMPAELLLAERGSQGLRSVARNGELPAPGCPVGTTTACVALRRGQVSTFDSSRSINTCPYLPQHPGGPCAATCVPVTVGGRPVGVLHATGRDLDPPVGRRVDQLVTLATQVGNRLGALRTLEHSRMEAATDGLTGLPNRRVLEAEVADLVERAAPFVMVLADLDRFKRLNDTYGHETGDKALQLFAHVLRDNVRGNDVVARLGGEEFVLVYPGITTETAVEALGRLRSALSAALPGSGVPEFTSSFGVAHSSEGIDGDSILRVADAGLLRAKEMGGDQVVVSDADLAAVVFSEGGRGERRMRDGGVSDDDR